MLDKKFINLPLLFLIIGGIFIAPSLNAKPVKPKPTPTKKTCATAYAGKPQCSLQHGYIYSSKHQAMNAMGWAGFKTISPKPSTQGTCKGYSTHWNVRDPNRGSDRIGSIASCECCVENNGNPTMKTIYKAFR